jgi:glycosyltransferase involved in cell wall biosynthesis
MPVVPISALVHTLNEVDQIEECLRSIDWVDQILLVDSFSTDGTVELVREKFPHVRIEQRVSLGSASQKNYGMDQVRNDWVLVVDADERVTPELRDEIRQTIMGSPQRWAYSIGRRNFMLGKELRYSGLQRDRVIRLFHREHARYPNRRVHAELVVDGEVGLLQGKLIHLYVRSFDHMAEKMTRYGLWGATQLYLEGKRTNGFDLFNHTFFRFIRDYFINRGFLDGTSGLIVVGMHVYYTFWKYSKLWEFSRLAAMGKEVPLPEIDGDESRWVSPWEKTPGPADHS